MIFLIAAAGTGGHVFPGLAVGEALVANGAARDDLIFVGGSRLESRVFPGAGFPFLEVELAGLKRSFSPQNLALPAVVIRARAAIAERMRRGGVRVALGMGGYATVPLALAARKEKVALMISEQNAGAGLANRIAARWSTRVFSSFPETDGLEGAEWVGNPIRSTLAVFNRASLRPKALSRFDLTDSYPVLGVFGGSLGAGSINAAVAELAAAWSGPPFQILHLTGSGHHDAMLRATAAGQLTWRRISFEDRMDLFYAASSLVIARSGGAVAELTATRTPAILVPGSFGSAGHQRANARVLEGAGAAVIVREERFSGLAEVVAGLLFDASRLSEMADSASAIARPDAANVIARAMMEAAR